MLTDIVTYLLARLLLVAALSVVIFYGAHALGIYEFPLVLAVLFAIVIALPLGIWAFSPLRRRATASIAAVDERRRADRAELRARLQGSDGPTPPQPPGPPPAI
jgi:ABC-type bacteriocin/lantibiotic exporter with double-glycine peptidase domain